MEFIYLLVGIAVGALASLLIARYKYASENQKSNSVLLVEQEKSRNLMIQLTASASELEIERKKFIESNNQLATAEANYRNLQEKLQEQKKELKDLNDKLSLEFKNLANEILEDKSKKFTELNKTNLSDILTPLRDKIKDFEKKVEDSNKDNNSRTSALQEQLKNLQGLNLKMTQEAENLTRALKGDPQAQGAWGEFILESILEKSGLERDREYSIQETFTTTEGRLRPDVIVRLPENRHVIIDSKVSLTAYNNFVNSELEEGKSVALKAHLLSIRNHMKGLAEKNYQNLSENGLNFIIMFIPIEPAYILAIQSEKTLYEEALEKRIVFVSPTLLIPSLQLIKNVWKQEYQNKNTQEIVRQVNALYEKFKGFTDDLIDLGGQIKKSQQTYEGAMNKLSTGSGNLVRRVEELKKLGITPSKNIDQRLVDKSIDQASLFDPKI